MSAQSMSHKTQLSVPSSAVSHTDVYAPLDSLIPEIRVVKLLPSEDFDAPIQCQLLNRPLHSESDGYEALSYVWGAPEFVEEILLNREPHLITRNLEMALRYLRLHKSQRILWVDAICINQNDPAERSQQVRLMKEIYANCKTDLAWMLSYKYTLEPPATESERGSSAGHPSKEKQLEMIHGSMETIGKAMDLMEKINMKDATILDELKTNANQMRFIYDEAEAEAEFGPPPTTTAFVEKADEYLLDEGQSQILSRAFSYALLWRRVWTMQEHSHAPHVVLVAGPYQQDWGVVKAFLGEQPYADAFHALFSHGHTAKVLDRVFGGSQKVDHQRRIMREPSYESKLIDVLARFQSNHATDPRDCIYGLLGLVTNQHGIVVDYNKSPAQVFEDTTVSLIEDARNLDILCQTTWTTSSALNDARLGKGVPGLPTWVPDFSRTASYDEHSRILFAQRGIYGAGRPTIDVPCKFEDGTSLSLQAVIMGRVQSDVALGSRATWNDGQYFAPQQWLEESEIGNLFAENYEKKYEWTGEPAVRAYWRTLLMDCAAYPITRLTSDEVLAGDAAFKGILAEREGSSARADESQDEFDSLAADALTGFWDQLPESMRCMWTRNYTYWTFAVTDNGLYTMVQNARAGDFIASVDGAKVPLVLREKGEFQGKKAYELVGTAYVHGLMDAEAFKMMAELGLADDQIFLH